MSIECTDNNCDLCLNENKSFCIICKYNFIFNNNTNEKECLNNENIENNKSDENTIENTIENKFVNTIVNTIENTIVNTIENTIVNTIESTIEKTIINTIESTHNITDKLYIEKEYTNLITENKQEDI